VRRATRLIIEERFPCAFAPVCLDDDVEAGVALLEVPLAHRRAVAPPRSFERLFDEERRRTRVLRTPSARGRAQSRPVYPARTGRDRSRRLQ
jgi:hypothetical protein